MSRIDLGPWTRWSVKSKIAQGGKSPIGIGESYAVKTEFSFRSFLAWYDAEGDLNSYKREVCRVWQESAPRKFYNLINDFTFFSRWKFVGVKFCMRKFMNKN